MSENLAVNKKKESLGESLTKPTVLDAVNKSGISLEEYSKIGYELRYQEDSDLQWILQRKELYDFDNEFVMPLVYTIPVFGIVSGVDIPHNVVLPLPTNRDELKKLEMKQILKHGKLWGELEAHQKIKKAFKPLASLLLDQDVIKKIVDQYLDKSKED